MKVEGEAGPGHRGRSSWAAAASRRMLGAGEDFAVSLALALMVLLPLAESFLRATLRVGISGSSAIVQHLTLVVGMLGGMIAARENRLLALATGAILPQGILKSAGRFLSSSSAATVAVLLTVAGLQFVQSERSAGNTLAYGVPIWLVQAVLPLGFAFVAVRLFRQAGGSWKARLGSVAFAGAAITVALHPPVAPAAMVVPALAVLLMATVLGAPVFATLGGAALILLWGAELPIASASIDHYRLVTNSSLPTIPLFTLAGYLLAEGGASQRLIRVFQSLFGGFRGGSAIITALVCAFFTTFTGASGVTILALGGLLMPILLAARYSEKSALGLITGAGSLGLLFPPCLPLILYAIIAKVEMKQMFLGGILPGILLVAMTAWWGVRQCPRVAASGPRFRAGEAARALWEAKWDLFLPGVAFLGLFGGFATPVEAAALTAFYAFIVEALIYRDLKLPALFRVMTECGLVIGGVLLILGVALGFTNYLVLAQIPDRGVEWVTQSIHSPLVFLLMLNLFLLVVGCLMDIFSAIIVVVPLIVPIGAAFHIDPIHLGIIFLANLELGYLTPPVGMNLFLASYRLGKPMPEVYRSVVPMLLVLLVGVLVITYVPALTTALPKLFGRGALP